MRQRNRASRTSQGPEKIRKIVRPQCLDGVATTSIVEWQLQTTLCPVTYPALLFKVKSHCIYDPLYLIVTPTHSPPNGEINIHVRNLTSLWGRGWRIPLAISPLPTADAETYSMRPGHASGSSHSSGAAP